MVEILRDEIPAVPALTLDAAVLEATKPEFHGCVFRCSFHADGSTWIEYGCYGGPWSVSGEAKELLSKRMQELNVTSKQVDIRPETKRQLMTPDRICHSCHYPVFQARK